MKNGQAIRVDSKTKMIDGSSNTWIYNITNYHTIKSSSYKIIQNFDHQSNSFVYTTRKYDYWNNFIWLPPKTLLFMRIDKNNTGGGDKIYVLFNGSPSWLCFRINRLFSFFVIKLDMDIDNELSVCIGVDGRHNTYSVIVEYENSNLSFATRSKYSQTFTKLYGNNGMYNKNTNEIKILRLD